MMFEKRIKNFIVDMGLDKQHYYDKSKFTELPLPRSLIEKIKKIDIDAIYLLGNNPTLLFKFSEDYDEKNIYHLLIKSWNFDKAPILFNVTNTNILIFNTFIFPEKGKLKASIIGTKKNIQKFNVSNLLNESFWENNKKNFNNKNRINQRLLNNIVDTKKVLLEQGLEEKIIHQVVGRSLFLRYIVDRNIIDLEEFGVSENIEQVFTDKKLLYKAFDIIHEYFNGDLFPSVKCEYEKLTDKNLNILYLLFSGGEISKGQFSLFSYYDFSIIPIELISNIYENFLHDGTNSAQSHYTPLATVDLVFEQLFGTSIVDKDNIKILDPSCGSGIFLVSFLKKYFENNKNDISPKKIFNFIKRSLYGIDIDEGAINITIFSIYITVLEFFEENFIKKHDFKFPTLLNKNFFVNDFFDLGAPYNQALGKFDIIIGNPPWGTICESKELYLKYCSDKKLKISDKQIAQAFLYRVNDFINDSSIVSLVIPSKIFYNNNANKFRNDYFFLFDIKAVIEMSLERKKTFSKAIHPSAIIFYKRKQKNDNYFTHLTLYPSIFYDLFKMFIFSEENIKTVRQEEVRENHWMWKSLLYGTQFDIKFLQKLISKHSNLKNFLENKNTVLGAGYIYKNPGKPLQEEVFNNYKNLLTNDKENTFFPNYIDLEQSMTPSKIYDTNTFHDLGSVKSYQAPHLLIKRGVPREGNIVVGVTESNCIFRNSVFGIHLKDKEILNFLAALYNSNIYKYFLFMTASSWGVERPEVLMIEHRRLPIPYNISREVITKLSKLYIKLEKQAKNNQGLSGVFVENPKEVLKLKHQINQVVNDEVFMLNSFEQELIEYALQIYPKIADNRIDRKNANQKEIDIYLNKFAQEISILFEKNTKDEYTPHVFKNEKFVFMYFKKSKENKEIIWLKTIDYMASDIIEATMKMSLESITNEIAFKRNIFGIDGENFYLIKPNQSNSFHKLNARLDAKTLSLKWIYEW